MAVAPVGSDHGAQWCHSQVATCTMFLLNASGGGHKNLFVNL